MRTIITLFKLVEEYQSSGDLTSIKHGTAELTSLKGIQLPLAKVNIYQLPSFLYFLYENYGFYDIERGIYL